MEFKFGQELIKALYKIRDAIKGESGEGSDNSVENDYIKFIQPVGIIHVTRDGSSVYVTIDEYIPPFVDNDGHLVVDEHNYYYLVYNRADVENNINDKFEYGYYETPNDKKIPVYFNYGNIRHTSSLEEFLSAIKHNESNPEFDEINISDITESNLENFVVVNIEFPIDK